MSGLALTCALAPTTPGLRLGKRQAWHRGRAVFGTDFNGPHQSPLLGPGLGYRIMGGLYIDPRMAPIFCVPQKLVLSQFYVKYYYLKATIVPTIRLLFWLGCLLSSYPLTFNLSNNRDLLFELQTLNVLLIYVYIINYEVFKIFIRNNSNKFITLSRK